MKKIRNWLVVLLLVPCLVMLAACGGGGNNKNPKDPDDGGNPSGNTDGWFASVAAEIRGAKLAPEFDDIMPGVLVGGRAEASPTSSASSSFGRASFLSLSAEPVKPQPCSEHNIVNCEECGLSMPQPDEYCARHGRPNCEECANAETITITSDELVSGTRNDDIKWVMKSFEDMVGSDEGSMTWLYIEMFLNSGLTEKGVWQEVGDAFIEWYIGIMPYLYSRGDYIPSPEEQQLVIDEMIRSTAGGVFFKYEEVGNDKIFYGDIPMVGAKIMLALKGNGAIEMFSSNDQVCTPNNHCDNCDGDESSSGYNYMYYHDNELLCVNYYHYTSEGLSDENISYWEFKKENGISIGKTVDMWTSDDGSPRIEARNIQGDNDSITMLTYYESDALKSGLGSSKYSSYKITTLVDGIVMTFGENDMGEITNLYFDAKAFENLGDITYSRIVNTETNYNHERDCAVHYSTWDDACDKGCDDVQTQISHDYKCGYYRGTRDNLCDRSDCVERSWASHPSECGWYYNNECTLACPIIDTWIEHTNNGDNICGFYTRSWDELCDMGCTESRTWINHKYENDNVCGVYTKKWNDFCDHDCESKPENRYTYTWSDVNLLKIEGMDPSSYNNFRIENKYEYVKVVKDDGSTYWSWTPSETEVYAFFEIGNWGWGHHDSSIGEITDIKFYFSDNFNGLELKSGFAEAFNSNRGGIKNFFDNDFNIDAFDSLDGEKIAIENFDLFKTAIMDYVMTYNFTRAA